MNNCTQTCQQGRKCTCAPAVTSRCMSQRQVNFAKFKLAAALVLLVILVAWRVAP